MSTDGDKATPDPMVVVQPTDLGAVLMHVATGDCYELNRVGTEIWNRLAQGESLSRIAAALADEYATTPETAENDVRLLVAELSRRGLIATRPR